MEKFSVFWMVFFSHFLRNLSSSMKSMYTQEDTLTRSLIMKKMSKCRMLWCPTIDYYFITIDIWITHILYHDSNTTSNSLIYISMTQYLYMFILLHFWGQSCESPWQTAKIINYVLSPPYKVLVIKLGVFSQPDMRKCHFLKSTPVVTKNYVSLKKYWYWTKFCKKKKKKKKETNKMWRFPLCKIGRRWASSSEKSEGQVINVQQNWKLIYMKFLPSIHEKFNLKFPMTYTEVILIDCKTEFSHMKFPTITWGSHKKGGYYSVGLKLTL